MALSPTSSRSSSSGGSGIPQGGPLTQDLSAGGFNITGVADLAASGLTGAVAASRWVGATAAGIPTTGTFAVGDYVVDQAGRMFVCITAGTPGSWWMVGDWLGFPTTRPLMSVADSAQSLNSRLYAMRSVGYGTITKLRIQVGTASGNICVGVYAGQTVGVASSQPGARKATSGTVACPSTGVQDVALTGAVEVFPGDWLAIIADNATATFRAAGSGNGGTIAGGGVFGTTLFTGTGGTALPLPSTITPVSWETKTYFMDGVA